jgi:hypothetical protein
MSTNYINVCARITKNAENLAINAESTKLWANAGGEDFSRHLERRAHLLRMRAMLHHALELAVLSSHPLDNAAA